MNKTKYLLIPAFAFLFSACEDVDVQTIPCGEEGAAACEVVTQTIPCGQEGADACEMISEDDFDYSPYVGVWHSECVWYPAGNKYHVREIIIDQDNSFWEGKYFYSDDVCTVPDGTQNTGFDGHFLSAEEVYGNGVAFILGAKTFEGIVQYESRYKAFELLDANTLYQYEYGGTNTNAYGTMEMLDTITAATFTKVEDLGAAYSQLVIADKTWFSVECVSIEEDIEDETPPSSTRQALFLNSNGLAAHGTVEYDDVGCQASDKIGGTVLYYPTSPSYTWEELAADEQAGEYTIFIENKVNPTREFVYNGDYLFDATMNVHYKENIDDVYGWEIPNNNL